MEDQAVASSGNPLTILLFFVANIVTSGFTYLLGRGNRKKAQLLDEKRVEIEEGKVEVADREVEIEVQRTTAADHQQLIDGFKDLAEQRGKALDWVRQEVQNLRGDIAAQATRHQTAQQFMRERIDAQETEVADLRGVHAQCQEENRQLADKVGVLTAENRQLADKVGVLTLEMEALKAATAPIG